MSPVSPEAYDIPGLSPARPVVVCERRLWDEPDGLQCTKTTPHVPGPGACRFVSDDVPQLHDTEAKDDLR